jgi:hypothetical protein
MDSEAENIIVGFLGELRLLRERTHAIRGQQPQIVESVSRLQSHAENIVKVISNPERKAANPYSQGPGRLQRAVMDQKSGLCT